MAGAGLWLAAGPDPADVLDGSVLRCPFGALPGPRRLGNGAYEHGCLRFWQFPHIGCCPSHFSFRPAGERVQLVSARVTNDSITSIEQAYHGRKSTLSASSSRSFVDGASPSPRRCRCRLDVCLSLLASSTGCWAACHDAGPPSSPQHLPVLLEEAQLTVSPWARNSQGWGRLHSSLAHSDPRRNTAETLGQRLLYRAHCAGAGADISGHRE